MTELTVAQDGIHGFYHKAENSFNDSKAIIVLGGSEGGERIPRELGALFSKQGIAALGVCYWNAPGLPQDLVGVPVETIELAVAWLQKQGHHRIGIYGISKGAELSLLAASLIPDITCVVALSPIHCVMAGIVGTGSPLNKKLADTSGFTWRGQSLPCARGKKDVPGMLARLITQQQVAMCFMYERALAGAPDEVAIPVENINGPVLLISPEQDAMWPSNESSRKIMKRLDEKAFPYNHQHLCYQYASHIMVPIGKTKIKIFKVERKYPAECDASRQDAFNKTVEFLKAW